MNKNSHKRRNKEGIMPSVIDMPKEQVHRGRKNRNGVQIGCFRFCTCMHLGFLSSRSGMLKLFELLLASCCETLLINFGMRELSATAFHSFLTTVSACLSTTLILCLCYTLSARSYCLIRQSLFVSLSIKIFMTVDFWWVCMVCSKPVQLSETVLKENLCN